MRLIDADELLKSYNLENAVKYPIGDGQGYDTMMFYEIADMICDAPTVDAVEVVRCCDCGKRDTEYCPMYHEIDCFTADGAWWIEQSDKRSDNGFCDRGERKEYV